MNKSCGARILMKGLSLEVVTPLLDIAQNFLVFSAFQDEKHLNFFNFAVLNNPDSAVPRNSFNELIAWFC